jgi:carbon storage regulator
MLILARRQGERVVIGDEILVTVMEVSGSTVRLGIEAPQGVSIFREEIWLAVKEENRAAAAAQADALATLPVGELPASSSGVERASKAGGEPHGPDTPQGPCTPRPDTPRGPDTPEGTGPQAGT